MNLLKTIRLLVYNFLILIIILIFLELISRFFIYLYIGNSTTSLQERTVNLNYQPYVMFGPDWRNQIIQFIENKNDFYTVLLIGASTAQNMPLEILKYEIENKLDRKIKIFNGTYGGYNSIQQFVFLSLFGLDIKPDLIITLDGANDIIF